MTITIIGNVADHWQVWAHLEPKADPRGAAESFLLGEGKTLKEAIQAAKGTLADATMALEELSE